MEAGLTPDQFWDMSPAEINVYITAAEQRIVDADKTYAHYVHMLMNKMRQSRKDKAVKPDQIRLRRSADEIPKEGIDERERRIKEERSGVVNLAERRRYLTQYQKKYGDKPVRIKPKPTKGGE